MITGTRILFGGCLLVAALAVSCVPRGLDRSGRAPGAPMERNPDWVAETLAGMSLEEKAAQLVFVWTEGSYIPQGSESWRTLVRLTAERKLGGFIFSIGDVYEYAVQINKLQALADIPLLIAADFEYGAGMRIRRSTMFPRAMALGATRDPQLAYEMARAIAREARALGVHQNYAPVADVNNNPDNPVINTRSFGDNPDLVAEMALAFIRGSQEEGVVATVKHFPGHGDTSLDTHLDLPVLNFTRARFDSLELPPFRRSIDEGVLSVMVGHIAAPALDSLAGVPATVSAEVSTRLLREQLGFDGLVVTDAMVMKGVSDKYHPAESAVLALRAGADLVLMPPDADIAIDAIVSAVRSGLLTESRLNESVRRILALKQWLGIDVQRYVDVDRVAEVVASPGHVLLAREIARKSITVLGDSSGLLPLAGTSNGRVVDLVLTDVDDLGSGDPFHAQLTRRLGDTEKIVLMPRDDSLDYSAALDTLSSADLIIAQFHFYTRSGEMTGFVPAPVKALVNELTARGKPIVGVSFGNPYVVAEFASLGAYACGYSAAPVVVEAMGEVLFGEAPARGKLPINIPGVYGYGSGIEYPQMVLRYGDAREAGFDPARLERIDRIVSQAIRDSVFPGAQLVVARNGMVVHRRSYGSQTYERYAPLVTDTTMYDLASVTKVIATTGAAMRLVDEGVIRLDDPVARYLPSFARNGKEKITVRNLLVHNSGLPAWRRLFELCATPECVVDSVYATSLVYETGDSTLYSDIGLIAAGKLIEKVTGTSLDRYADSVFFQPLGMTRTMFNPPVSIRDGVAPTEVDNYWRRTGTPVVGRVHDENAAALGGVAGHAGLFSTASDLVIYAQMLLNGGRYGRNEYVTAETIRHCTARQSAESTRGIGWDTRGEGESFSGSHSSPSTYLHTGFTGTSIMIDPDRQMIIILLTNRVHPTRNNGKIYRLRPSLHDAVYEALLE